MTDLTELNRLEALLNTLAIERPAWQADAACRGKGPDLFFPERGDTNTNQAALAICRTCPVTQQCLDMSLDTPVDRDGIWGGHTGRERRAIRQQRWETRSPQHGTRATYIAGCRCEPCTDANTTYTRQRRHVA